jgi:hypothetical protein
MHFSCEWWKLSERDVVFVCGIFQVLPLGAQEYWLHDGLIHTLSVFTTLRMHNRFKNLSLELLNVTFCGYLVLRTFIFRGVDLVRQLSRIMIWARGSLDFRDLLQIGRASLMHSVRHVQAILHFEHLTRALSVRVFRETFDTFNAIWCLKHFTRSTWKSTSKLLSHLPLELLSKNFLGFCIFFNSPRINHGFELHFFVVFLFLNLKLFCRVIFFHADHQIIKFLPSFL